MLWLCAAVCGGLLVGVFISEYRAKGLLDKAFDDGYYTGAYDAYNLVAQACEKPDCKHAAIVYREFKGNHTFRRLCAVRRALPAPTSEI